MSYDKNVSSLRSQRKEIINNYRETINEGTENFKYFSIDSEWKIQTNLIFRKPKDEFNDFKINFLRVGVVDFSFRGVQKKLSLFQSNNNYQKFFIFVKDKTSGNSTYDRGRFVPVIQENDNYYLEFNVAYAPACAHTKATNLCPNSIEKIELEIKAGECN